MRRGKGRAFVGFLLTYFLISSLICTSAFVVLKSTVLKGNDVKEFIKGLDFGEVVEEVVNESINSTVNNNSNNNNSENSNNENGNTSNNTTNLADKILTDDVMNDVTDVMVDAITEDKEVDLADIKDSCMVAVTEMSEQAVDDILEELKNNATVIDAETLKNNSVIQQYQADFNIDVTTPILEQMETVYGSKSVNLDEIDIEEVKSEAKQALKEDVIPTIEKDVDKLIQETNVEVNNQLKVIKKETNVKGITDAVDLLIKAVMKAIIGGAVATLVFVVLMFVVYKKDINKAFKNIGISGILLSVVMFAVGALINIVNNIIKKEFNGNEVEDKIVNSVVGRYLPKVGNAANTIAIVAIATAVLMIVAAIVIKKKLSQKDELFTTADTFTSNQMETANVNEALDNASDDITM